MSIKSFIEELDEYTVKTDKHLFVESKANHAIVAAINVLQSIRENFDEKEADEFAQNNLIQPNQWEILLKEYRPKNDQTLISFSKHYNINPAIVLGRLSWEADFYKFKSGIDKSLY